MSYRSYMIVKISYDNPDGKELLMGLLKDYGESFGISAEIVSEVGD